MGKNNERHKLVLAVSPTTRGFGFAVFEGPTAPIDWGVKEIRRNKNAACLEKVIELKDFYQADIIVIEDTAEETSRRRERIRSLLSSIFHLATERGIHYQTIPQSMILEVFGQFGASTKYQIAKTIVEWLPELSSRLPRYRKPWMSEDYRMGIFDAASLALVFYYTAQ